jgi:hypothetical protein
MSECDRVATSLKALVISLNRWQRFYDEISEMEYWILGIEETESLKRLKRFFAKRLDEESRAFEELLKELTKVCR